MILFLNRLISNKEQMNDEGNFEWRMKNVEENCHFPPEFISQITKEKFTNLRF